MIVTSHEKIFIPHTLEGIAYADKFQAELEGLDYVVKREEDTSVIILLVNYKWEVKDNKEV